MDQEHTENTRNHIRMSHSPNRNRCKNRKQRLRVSADIAARLKKPAARRGSDGGVYAAIAAGRHRSARENPAELGKRIMTQRNANMKK